MKKLFCCGEAPIAGKGGLALLLLRLVAGLAFIQHGYPKFQHATSWMGPDATIPAFLQALAATSEFLGGFAILFGLLTRLGALGIWFTMAYATYFHHSIMHDPFVGSMEHPGSYELALVYFVIMSVLLLRGAGAYSLDGILAKRCKK
jgi:putative oxidoreductase